MVRNRFAFAGLLVGVAGVVACTTVRRVQPDKFFATNSPDVVWVTYTNNSIVPVSQAEMAGDTLKGMRQGTQEPVAIPLDQVRSVQARLPDRTKTVLLVAGGLTGFVASVYVLWISQAGPKTGGTNCGYNEDAIAIPYC